MPSQRKIRYAVIGLGYISQIAVLPAFKHAKKNSELAALVSGDSQKLKSLSQKYKTKLNYHYNQIEELFQSGEIDAVYIALPNHLHRKYAELAANYKLHILCEKPMAPTVDDCDAMIAAAESNNVKLMIAYRLHFEEANLKAIQILNQRKIGDPKYFESLFSMQVKNNNIRTNEIGMGGGTLYDIGIYCINAARYLFQSEPVEVMAMSTSGNESRFSRIDETTSAVLRFSNDRLASFTTSYGSSNQAVYKIVGTKGALEVENAYEYHEKITHVLKIGDRKTKKAFSRRDQFAPELLYFSDCILKNKEIEPSGEEGLADVAVIQALYLSAKTGRVISLSPSTDQKNSKPDLSQELQRPSVEKEKLIHATESFRS